LPIITWEYTFDDEGFGTLIMLYLQTLRSELPVTRGKVPVVIIAIRSSEDDCSAV